MAADHWPDGGDDQGLPLIPFLRRDLSVRLLTRGFLRLGMLYLLYRTDRPSSAFFRGCIGAVASR